MSTLLAIILSVSAPPSGGNVTPPAPAAAPAPAEARSGKELADAAHAALRKWAKATDQQADAAARDLLGIYCEIQQDTRMARSQRETLRTTVRNRLDQLSSQISKRIAKDKPANAQSAVASVEGRKGDKVLGGVGMPVGGAAAGFGNAAAGPNGNDDNGQALIDLIQSTISPKSWETNGGACTIHYWRQQRAIVVRATGEVHDQVSDTLEQLNRATH